MQPDVEPCVIETFEASDGYRMHYRHYPAQSRTLRGQVVAIHGIQSHGGWYVGCCQHLTRAGWEVFFLDRRGSGLNEKARGDTPNHRRLIDDLKEFIENTCSERPFLLAISWGAKLGVALESVAPCTTKGLVLVAPGFFPRIDVSLGEKLMIGLARLVWPWTRFPIPLNHPELFTSTPEWIEFLRNDPLALHEATSRLLFASRRLDWIVRKARQRIMVPVLILLGQRDRIIDNERTRAFAAKFAVNDCRVIEYPNARHTLEFEPDPLPYYRDVERWLEMHNALE